MVKSSFGCCNGALVAGPKKVALGAGGIVIENVEELDVAPSGLAIVIVAAPGFAMRAAVTFADSCVDVPVVPESATPFHCTIEPGTNPVPFTVSVNAAPAAFVEDGARLVIAGRWPPIVNETLLDAFLSG